MKTLNITALWTEEGDCYGDVEIVFKLWVDGDLVVVDRPCVR
jgi:hypothetical protein